jgi:ABC-type Fe3+-hydroxamate transport system substrate-binding protein
MFFRDQLNREVEISKPPERIISLVPSITELLYDLGLNKRIVGQTIFCIHPQQQFKNNTKVGGTKKLQIDKIRLLKPDLIIGNKEENDKVQIEQLMHEFPVWISDVNTFDESISMINSLGEITGSENQAKDIINKILQQRFGFSNEKFPQKRVLYLIWREPYIAVGKSTFIDAMLNEAGFENVITSERYPEIKESDFIKFQPDFIFLSSEPHPFTQNHAKNINGILNGDKCILVDGELFSWYGSRMIKSFSYFKELQKQLQKG